MIYPYMTLNDNTEITHTEELVDGRVKVYIETPVDYGFHSAVCYLPKYEWEDVNGYSDAEISYYEKLLKNNAHTIIEFSREGGFDNAPPIQD